MKNKAMRVGTGLLAACLLIGLLVGCGPQPTSTSPPVPSDILPTTTPEPTASGEAEAFRTVNLYYPETHGLSLKRQGVQMPSTQLWYLDIITQLLLQPPEEAGLSPLFEGRATLDRILQSKDVALVFLTGDLEALSEQSQFVSVIALINTLTELPDVEYVEVMLNGKRCRSINAMSYVDAGTSMNLESQWIRHQYYREHPEEKQLGETRHLLFFKDQSGSLLLPSVATGNVYDNDGMMTVLGELQQGPRVGESLVAAMSNTLQITRTATASEQVGGVEANVASVWLTSPKHEIVEGMDLTLLCGSMTATLQMTYPKIDYVRIYMDNKLTTALSAIEGDNSGNWTLSHFLPLIGETTTLYFPQSDGLSLYPVERAVNAERAHKLRASTEELLAGPQTYDPQSITYAFPLGVSAADLLGLEISGDLVTVNFSQHFLDCCAGLEAAQERNMVYSLVNTLTQYDEIRRVRILIEGQAVTALSGYLNLSNPLMRNPGLIQAQNNLAS